MSKKFISAKEVSELTGYTEKTLQQDRHRKKGFPYYTIGRKVFYDRAEILEIFAQGRVEVEPHSRAHTKGGATKMLKNQKGEADE